MGRPLGDTAKGMVEDFGPEHLLKHATQRDLADLTDLIIETVGAEIRLLRNRVSSLSETVAQLEDVATRP